MTHFFLSYRRGDIAAKTLIRFLAKEVDLHFGKGTAFYDVQSIPSGEDFEDVLQTTLQTCSGLVALIGNPEEWLGKTASGLRISDPKDWVRTEIEIALRMGKKVIPLLIDDGKMPHQQSLPPSIATFSNLQASRISTGTNFNNDLERLVDDLVRVETHLGVPKAFDGKSLEENLQGLWTSEKTRESKIIGTQMLCRGLAMPSLVYEMFHLRINIKDPDGNSDFEWLHSGFNVTNDHIEGEAKSLWFENPQTRPIEINATSDDQLPPAIKVLRDYANYKDFYCRFTPSIAPRAKFSYAYKYHAPKMFTQDHYWDWKTRNITLFARITITHRKLKAFKHCTVEEHTNRGQRPDKRGAVTVEENDGTVVIDWSIAMPKLDAIYRINWSFINDVSE